MYRKARQHPAIHGLNRYRDFAEYELLYVGISKAGDAFTRLVVNAHEARTAILSNEYPASNGARVTDELFLMFFGIDPLHILVVESDDELDGVALPDGPNSMENSVVVADAEKAFTSVLQSRYNKVRYKNYPRGGDGLYDSGLLRHAYVVNEALTFFTAEARIRGAFDKAGLPADEADSIWIEGDKVELLTREDLHGRRNQDHGQTDQT